MITKDQVVPLLLQACPSFSERFRNHRAYYGDDESLYADLGEFALHVVELYNEGRAQELPAVFDTVERLHVEGDDYVKEAATIGLIEDIQNVAGNRGLNAEVFVPYLKRESAKRWNKLNDFWNGKM